MLKQVAELGSEWCSERVSVSSSDNSGGNSSCISPQSLVCPSWLSSQQVAVVPEAGASQLSGEEVRSAHSRDVTG